MELAVGIGSNVDLGFAVHTLSTGYAGSIYSYGMNFKTGDRVRISESAKHKHRGKTGRVVGSERGLPMVRIQLDFSPKVITVAFTKDVEYERVA